MSTKAPKHKRSVSFPIPIHDAIEALAEIEGVDFSDLITEGAKIVLAQNNLLPPPPTQEQLDAAISELRKERASGPPPRKAGARPAARPKPRPKPEDLRKSA